MSGTRASPRSGTATANRQLASAASPAAQEKAEQARLLAEALQRILDLPKEEFPLARRGTPPPLPAIDTKSILRRHAMEARTGISIFDRQARKEALTGARERARVEADELERLLDRQLREWEQELEQEWGRLKANDPRTVLAFLATAFEDNEAAAAAVGVLHDEVSLVVVVPSVDVVPDRKPSTTAKGNLSLKKLTRRETADFYKLVVCGHVLVTLKECFATAPGLASARIVAVRPGRLDSYGRQQPEVMMAAQVARSALGNVRWESTDAAHILTEAASDLAATQKGVTKELQPIDLAQHPDLALLVEAVDFDDMTAPA